MVRSRPRLRPSCSLTLRVYERRVYGPREDRPAAAVERDDRVSGRSVQSSARPGGGTAKPLKIDTRQRIFSSSFTSASICYLRSLRLRRSREAEAEAVRTVATAGRRDERGRYVAAAVAVAGVHSVTRNSRERCAAHFVWGCELIKHADFFILGVLRK
jgi:hypothetical protein